MKLALITWQMAMLAAVAALSFLLVGQCNRAGLLAGQLAAQKAELARADEAHGLELAGVQQAHEATQEALQRELDDQVRAKGYLSDALAKALKAAPHATPIASATGSTGPVHVDGGALPPSALVPAAGTEAPSPPSVPASVCLLSPDDSGEIRVSGVALRTVAGNVVIAAQAEAWRVTANSPQTRLFGGELHLDAKYLKPPSPPREAGWGSGIALTVGRRGWAVGPAVAIPPLSLWRLQLEPSAALTLGAGGEFAGVGQVIGRWR